MSSDGRVFDRGKWMKRVNKKKEESLCSCLSQVRKSLRGISFFLPFPNLHARHIYIQYTMYN